MSNKTLREGDITWEDGCFTFEQHIAGMTLEEIAKELGLPEARLTKGGFVVFAIQPPSPDDFELGGWAEYSTDNFIEKGAWNRMDFERTYKDKRMPISIFQAKNGWMQEMNHQKLVKVVLNIPHNNHRYPAGRLAPQIILMKSVKCVVVKYLPPNSKERFKGVWK